MGQERFKGLAVDEPCRARSRSWGSNKTAKQKKNMTGRLQGKKVVILATDGFEESVLLKPLEALKKEGAHVEVVWPKSDEIQGFNHMTPDKKVRVDNGLDRAKPDDYDAIVLPGGAQNPDHLRTKAQVQKFVRAFADAGKPLAAICHAPWILIDAGLEEPQTDRLADDPA